MNERSFNSSIIFLNTKRCKACWQCIQICSNNVFDRIDLPWHKHAIIRSPDNCAYCKQCINICTKRALTEISIAEYEKIKGIRKLIFSFNINILLFVAALISALSGLIIQFSYHIGNLGNSGLVQINSEPGYCVWVFIHKACISFLTVLTGIHIFLHVKWYKNVIIKKMISKNIQVISLSIIFLLLAITGFVPWLINIADGNQYARKVFIEIHDKFSLIFIIFFILHLIKRTKWYINTYNRIKLN